jgi:ornithine carbamoyltransferase
MLFDKPSLRTRFSFTVAMHELGGTIIESLSDTRKKEEPEDLTKVLSGYCNGIMIRTHSDENLHRMEKVSSIPIINALSDDHHPCQILADLLTLQEKFGNLEDLKVTYVGDGNNILHSLLLMAPIMGIHLHYCCPVSRGPKTEILSSALAKANLSSGSITAHTLPPTAVIDAHAVYTDVWTSMGFEKDASEELFAGFQVNEELMALASPKAIFMHCMPMVRGKEVSKTLPDSPQSVIFQQSENRLHVQKAILITLLGEQI